MSASWLLMDGTRLKVAIVASLAANVGLFAMLSTGATRVLSVPLNAVEIRRVTIDDKGHKIEKIIKPQEIKKKVEKIIKEHPKVELRQPKQQAPPEAVHNKVLTAPTDKGSGSSDFTAPADGNAKLGAPVAAHEPQQTTTAAPPAVQPQPKQDKVETNPAPVVEQPKPEPPKPKGPTRDASPSDTVQPEIPDDLKNQSFKSFVRVKVVVQEDGGFTVVLRTSSGNADVDKRVLDALKQWKWKPALHEGQPVQSTQLFKFEFEVN